MQSTQAGSEEPQDLSSVVLELSKTCPTALGSSCEACLPLPLPLGNACAPGMLKLASQLCSTLAQEPQSPGTARQVCQGGSILLGVTGPMQADTAAGEPFPICLPVQGPQSIKQPKAVGRRERVSSLDELAEAAQDPLASSSPSTSHFLHLTCPRNLFPLAWAGGFQSGAVLQVLQKSCSLPCLSSSQCLPLLLPSMAPVQRRLERGGGKHRSCRGNRPFLAEQPPSCWAELCRAVLQRCSLPPPPYTQPRSWPLPVRESL